MTQIKPLKAEKFIREATENLAPYKGTFIYGQFTRDFRDKTDQDSTVYGSWISALTDYLTRTYSPGKKPRILDCGCGTGELAVRMASLGYDVVGIDVNKRHIELARVLAAENGLYNVTFIANDRSSLPFDDKSFDIVTSFSVFEHMSDSTLQWVIPELSRVTKGAVYILIPNILKMSDDHTGLAFVPFIPRWLSTLYVRARGRRHPSSMTPEGIWDVYYRSFWHIKGLFARFGFKLELPPDDVVYPPLSVCPPRPGIGKTFWLGKKHFFIGIPLPWGFLRTKGFPRESMYSYMNLIFVPPEKKQTALSNEVPTGDKGAAIERIDPKYEHDIRSKSEHISRYRSASQKKYGKVLDIGCGTGYGSKMLHDQGNDVYGIDISDKAVDYAKKNYPGPVFSVASCEKLPFPDGSFDAVTAFEIIEHTKDPAVVLSEIRRVLKKDGELFISTPNPRHLKSILKHFLLKIPYPEKALGDNIYHVKEFYYDEFLALLRAGGFKVILTFGQTVPFIPALYRFDFDPGRSFPRYAVTVVAHAVRCS